MSKEDFISIILRIKKHSKDFKTNYPITNDGIVSFLDGLDKIDEKDIIALLDYTISLENKKSYEGYLEILKEYSPILNHIEELINSQGREIKGAGASLIYKNGLMIPLISSFAYEMLNEENLYRKNCSFGMLMANKDYDNFCGMTLEISDEKFTFYVGTVEETYERDHLSLELSKMLSQGKRPSKVVKISLEDGYVYIPYIDNVVLFDTQEHLRKYALSLGELINKNMNQTNVSVKK